MVLRICAKAFLYWNVANIAIGTVGGLAWAVYLVYFGGP